ncbi:hypothetical protein Ae406Ps2_0440c [Pseudonocardia sp. Ae406_Ps2]|uniref:hypothetical protein n=1 Tax=unclassified Pseudonocardia TaxID=2619320 RepID=UPI00094B039C|nr:MULTISPECIES: hypothetical protein [unclassified Pseudonocardia]OLM00440.1 hypothetical protein Ae406Ps2_0440c [Pseudonocardia sp. Ae406_Ps2]OLM13987.1 hypothetical protein Ae505Ps2_4116c [Pseudonocardia sp. Ae505_Ps2]OLM22014.1 hypothetical protein Ae706Ps2_0446c [Pseudonocardia sp. Ae706_Ps2]OLM31090.1 hypothetical protein Ae717Ps2_1985c [Pseudonocardia sp. Ae717_Ps2]
MSAPHADDRTPARPDGRRNGHPTTLLTGAAPADGLPAPGTAAPTTGPVTPGPVPAPRAGGWTGTQREPAPEPTELTGPVDARNRPGPRTPPLPWPAVPAEQRPVGGVPAQRTGPAVGAQAPWTTGPVPGPGRAPFPTAPWAVPVQGGPVQSGPVQAGSRAAAPVPVVYPPGHAASGTPAGRWDALRDRLSAARLPDGGLRDAVGHRTAAIAVAATLVLAAAVVVAAYVGSGRTGDPGAPQGAGSGPAPVAAPAELVAGTTAADPAAFGSPASFTSPTGNISCRITGGAGDGAVRCDVTARTWSAGDCPDAALVTGGPAGARTECGGAPVTSGAAVLDYGTHLTQGDVTCVSSRTGVECRDARTGAGFAAARAAYRLY